MRKLFIAILLLIPCLLLAESTLNMATVRIKEFDTKGQQKVTITADSVQIQPDKGISEFTGKVKITMGNTLITSDKVTAYFDSNNELTKIVAQGHANATQGHNSISGPHIEYDIKKAMLTTPASKKQRTTMVLYPNELPKSRKDKA